ncbi:unnamed protein product, partial [Nippostrongylus brasiliensis]|uniref:SET domain-containing protein n=1 Tax=Nippostrongylus brasiliensis TaxID=27835 RepID=A0A0N4YQG4_NIPBR
ASANVSVCNYDIKPIITRSRAPPTPEFVDVHELWDHYVSRAEYHPILSSSEVQCPKARSRLQDRKVLVEKISQLKRIEQCIAQGIRQVTTFEFFNYVNPLCPGLNDVATDVFMISCNGDRDFLSQIVVPCRSTHHHDPPVLYYAVPPTIFIVVKVHIEQKYHYIGSARRVGRSRGDHEDEESTSTVFKRVLYGVRRVATGENGEVTPLYGNHTVVLINSDTDQVDGISFKFSDEKWMANYAQLEQFAKIGNKLCASGPIGLINFGVSDEHVDYDWSLVEKIMDSRAKRKCEQWRSANMVVWYHYEAPKVYEDNGAATRGSPSSDKENSALSPSRKLKRSPQKSPMKTLSPRKTSASSRSSVNSLTPREARSLAKAAGKALSPKDPPRKSPVRALSPRKCNGFAKATVVGEIESQSAQEDLQNGVFDRKSFPFAIHYLVTSVITRADWENPPTEPEQKSKKPVAVAPSSPKKVLYAPPSEVPVKKKNELPKAQMIPYGEMSFVHPTYSRVPGPSSAKVYHSVIEDTCDWKMHLIERNIRDYIDDTPQEKEFMLLHNQFRSKFRHSIVGEKLTLEFYTKFVETCGMEMKKKRIRAHCVARLTRLKSFPFAIHYLVTSVITRADWENPPTEPEQKSKKPVAVAPSSPKKVLYAPPSEVPVKKKNELPKAQMIPYGEMSFVHPTYSRVPGPSSAKVYHSVIEDTCDWKMHLIERNIRDYIDDTPQEKEFMLLHNQFRSKFRHSIVGEKLTLEFYTKFVETCGMEMKKKRIRAHCVARLTRLVQQNKMSPNNMAILTQKLYELGANDRD